MFIMRIVVDLYYKQQNNKDSCEIHHLCSISLCCSTVWICDLRAMKQAACRHVTSGHSSRRDNTYHISSDKQDIDKVAIIRLL